MNVNIVLDSDYICSKLSEGKEEAIDVLFTYFKQKSNIIIIQDNEKIILRNIIKHQKLKEQNIKNTEIFLTSLINGTNKDFAVSEKYENDFLKFVQILKDREYPVQIVISDKKIDPSIETFLIEDVDKIFEIIEKSSQKHRVTDNEKLLTEKNINILSFIEYEKILFNTFWCSSRITIVAKEFWEGVEKGKFAEKNRAGYKRGLEYLIKIFNQIEKITKKKVEIEIITGIKEKFWDEIKMSPRKSSDSVYDFLRSVNPNINFKLKILKWDIGDETIVGEAHGRRIYSDYGGLETEYHPFDLFNYSKYKDTSFHWIGEKERLNLLNNMTLIAERPETQL